MNWPIFAKEKILDPNIDLESTCLKIKQSGLSIASLNGSFDLVHAGHLHMLYEASKQGDKLIVALNSDSSIKKYKSHQRPLIPLEQRIILITGFSFVDYVTWFEEETPLNILDLIKPHTHINGSEYGKNCIEKEIVEKNGGILHIVKLIPQLSTSNLIEKIKNL